MANENKFRRLQCEQACRKLIEEAGGGFGQIVTLTSEQAVLYVMGSLDLTLENIKYPLILVYDRDMGTNYNTVEVFFKMSEDPYESTMGYSYGYQYSNVKLTDGKITGNFHIQPAGA